MANEVQKPKFRRKTFLIDKGFQLKYTLIIALIGAIIAGLWGYGFYHQSRQNSDQLMLTIQVDPELQALSEHVEKKLLDKDLEILYLLGIFIVMIVTAITIWGVLITHRIAGPIFIISRYVVQVANGEYPDPRPLRKKDELHDFFVKFNDMLTAIKDREKGDVATLNKAMDSAKNVLPSLSGDKAGEFARTLELLREMQTRKQKMLEGPSAPPAGDA